MREYRHRCARCGKDNPELHHIDEDPRNNSEDNLIPLCPNCHHNWVHRSPDAAPESLMRFFRRYKNRKILAPEFRPLFARLEFLNASHKMGDVGRLQGQASDLIRFVREHERGGFYAGEIASLLRYEDFTASFTLGADGLPPQWYIDGKNREIPRYLAKLQSSRDRVYELIVEMLTYQPWSEEPETRRS